MGLYSSVLPFLQQFVKLFEMKEPLIHELHEQQVCVVQFHKIVVNKFYNYCHHFNSGFDNMWQD